mgnify:CR=1 FL=1
MYSSPPARRPEDEERVGVLGKQGSKRNAHANAKTDRLYTDLTKRVNAQRTIVVARPAGEFLTNPGSHRPQVSPIRFEIDVDVMPGFAEVLPKIDLLIEGRRRSELILAGSGSLKKLPTVY